MEFLFEATGCSLAGEEGESGKVFFILALQSFFGICRCEPRGRWYRYTKPTESTWLARSPIT